MTKKLHSCKYLPKENSKMTSNVDSTENNRYVADKKKMKKLDEDIRKKNLMLMGSRKWGSGLDILLIVI